MTQNWYWITDTKLLIILGISLVWIFAGWLLYGFVGVSHGPEGGIDKIADTLVYILLWKLLIYVPPILVSGVSFSLWLYQNHPKSIKWVLLAIAGCIMLSIAYKKCFRKMIDTPKRIAAHIISYENWLTKQKRYKIHENITSSDYICDYVKSIISDAISECCSMYPDDDISTKTLYINAAMEAHYQEIPGVTGWEYIPDVRDIVPARADGDGKFLLNNRDLCLIAEHFQRSFRREHWYDRYQFKDFVIAEWYSWLPMTAVFYDDGTMDLVITPP